MNWSLSERSAEEGVTVAVELRLLGDIQLRVDGRVADLGHSRQQCVLVALLLDGDRVVPVDQLLFRVWGDRPPQRARDVLYSYLSRLRQVLGDRDGPAIVRQRGGYQVTLDPMAVDVHRFANLVRRAGTAGDGETAGSLLRQALGLWRGEAFSTLDTPWLNNARETLNKQRLAAFLDSNDLELARGRHAAVVDDLATWSAEYPLDERLTGQFMLALYQCGRQAQALQIFQRTRLRLAEELGADPSPPLRQLHQQILAAHPTLSVSAPRPAAAPVPRQLPAPPALFTGRDNELAELDETMATRGAPAGPAICVISGTGGVGKTWLAIRWAHSQLDDYPDGQLYADLRGFDPTSDAAAPAAVLRTFLGALGVPAGSVPTDTEAQAGLYRSLLANRRMLIVLDNARDTAQVTPLLPGAGGCGALVTSRNQLAGLVTAHGGRPLALEMLSETDARALLAGQLGVARIAAEPDPVDVLLTVCGGLPLALGIVAARARLRGATPLSVLAAELRQASTCLDGFDGGEVTADLRAVFAGSCAALPPQPARVLRLVSLAPGPDVGIGAAASLTALPVDQVHAALRQLVAASLITEHPLGRFQLHDLVRLYAAEWAREVEPVEHRTRAVHRVLDHYLHTAHAAALCLEPQRICATPAPCAPGVTALPPTDPGAAVTWFTAEHDVLLAAVDLAADTGFDAHVWQLACSLTTFFDRRGHWHDRVVTQRAALAAARRLADRWAQAHSHRGLALAYTLLGRFDDAGEELRSALDLFEELADPVGQARSYRSLARVWAQQGRHDLALPYDRRSLEVYQAIGHRSGQATALNAIGWHHAHLGDHEQALAYCQEALVLQEEMDDRHAQGATLDSLGFAHHQLGQDGPAIDCYQRALRLYRETGERYLQAGTLGRLGDARHAAGDREGARRAWQQAIDVLDELGHPDANLIREKLHRPDRTALLSAR